jgi:hypothetical protein
MVSKGSFVKVCSQVFPDLDKGKRGGRKAECATSTFFSVAQGCSDGATQFFRFVNADASHSRFAPAGGARPGAGCMKESCRAVAGEVRDTGAALVLARRRGGDDSDWPWRNVIRLEWFPG